MSTDESSIGIFNQLSSVQAVGEPANLVPPLESNKTSIRQEMCGPNEFEEF